MAGTHLNAPLAAAGASTRINPPNSLNFTNCTSTAAADVGVRSASTALKNGNVSRFAAHGPERSERPRFIRADDGRARRVQELPLAVQKVTRQRPGVWVQALERDRERVDGFLVRLRRGDAALDGRDGVQQRVFRVATRGSLVDGVELKGVSWS
eukprot:31172-Pelagococcus_subviridis.AAC.3